MGTQSLYLSLSILAKGLDINNIITHKIQIYTQFGNHIKNTLNKTKIQQKQQQLKTRTKQF